MNTENTIVLQGLPPADASPEEVNQILSYLGQLNPRSIQIRLASPELYHRVLQQGNTSGIPVTVIPVSR